MIWFEQPQENPCGEFLENLSHFETISHPGASRFAVIFRRIIQM